MVEQDLQLGARRLVRAARSGMLATQHEGQPYATLVTPGTAPDGSILLLLSDLAEHTRHLRHDGRCSVLAVGEDTGPNPQQAARVTVFGTAIIEHDTALRARWVAQHPYAGFYAGFGDFNLWRLTPDGGLVVAGFGRAKKLSRTDLMVPGWAPNGETLAQITHRQADAIASLAAALGQQAGGWALVAGDADGVDLGHAERRTVRVAFPAPLSPLDDPEEAIAGLAARHACRWTV